MHLNQNVFANRNTRLQLSYVDSFIEATLRSLKSPSGRTLKDSIESILCLYHVWGPGLPDKKMRKYLSLSLNWRKYNLLLMSVKENVNDFTHSHDSPRSPQVGFWLPCGHNHPRQSSVCFNLEENGNLNGNLNKAKAKLHNCIEPSTYLIRSKVEVKGPLLIVDQSCPRSE